MMQIAFLFGSGISLPAGLPNVQNLTNEIVSGKDFHKATDGNFYQSENPMGDFELVKDISKYLKYLGNLGQAYFGESKQISYEDIYFIAAQVRDHLFEEVNNPVLVPMISQLEDAVQKLCLEKRDFADFANDACHYILDATKILLWNIPKSTDYLEFLHEAYNSPLLNSIDIFTLNHDRVIETYLNKKAISYFDGFETETNELRWRIPFAKKEPSTKLGFYKLHGSIDWYRMNSKTGEPGFGEVAILLNGDHWHALNPQSELIMSSHHFPLVLVGTFNKMAEYSHDIFSEKYYAFLQSLSQTNILVVCGYSFGDKGLNVNILEWMFSNQRNRVVIIHGSYEELKKSARNAIASKLDAWRRNGRLIHINKWIEELRWSDISLLL